MKVLGSNGSGSLKELIAGVVWAVEQAATKAAAAASKYAATGRTDYKGSVINLSVGGGKSRTLEDALNRAVDSGVHMAVVAGMYHREIPHALKTLMNSVRQ